MNILITGGWGFIGSHLSEKLLLNGENKLFLLDNLLTGRKQNIEHLDKDKIVFKHTFMKMHLYKFTFVHFYKFSLIHSHI